MRTALYVARKTEEERLLRYDRRRSEDIDHQTFACKFLAAANANGYISSSDRKRTRFTLLRFRQTRNRFRKITQRRLTTLSKLILLFEKKKKLTISIQLNGKRYIH